MPEHTVKSYDEELNQMTGTILRMGGMVEQQLAEAITALVKRDPELAARVIQDDKPVDRLEHEVDHLVMRLLALRQPMAVDLRLITASLKISSDLERIGDYAKSLSELCQWQSDSEGSDAGRQLHKKIAPLFGQLLQALRDEDVNAARQVMRTHEEVKIACDTFVTGAFQDEASNRHTVVQVMAVRFLRRISAHLSNVASSVVNPLDRIGGKEQE